MDTLKKHNTRPDTTYYHSKVITSRDQVAYFPLAREGQKQQFDNAPTVQFPRCLAAMDSPILLISNGNALFPAALQLILSQHSGLRGCRDFTLFGQGAVRTGHTVQRQPSFLSAPTILTRKTSFHSLTRTAGQGWLSIFLYLGGVTQADPTL